MWVVRVRRPGHSMHPDGPQSGLEIPDLVGLPDAVATLVG